MTTNDFGQQITFLQDAYIPMLRHALPDPQRHWGKMSFQGMIEHMSDSFRQGNGKDLNDCDTPAERVAAMQAFLRTDKPFRENTVNARMPEEPMQLRQPDLQSAIAELQQEIVDFFDLFLQNKDRIVTNPIFGDLNYELWVRLLYKHAVHHLRQFGLLDREVSL